MDDAQFEQELDQYVNKLVEDNHVTEKNGNMDSLKTALKNKLSEEIDLELLDRISKENSKKIDEMADTGKLTREELKQIVESEQIDYADVVKVASERFEKAFLEVIKEQKGAKNE